MIYGYDDGSNITGPFPLPQSWENISGFNNLSIDDLATYGWYPFVFVKDQSQGSDKVDHTEVKLIDGVINSIDVYRAYTDQEKVDNDYQMSMNAKAQRDQLLQACDYTQLSDVILDNKDEWISYRQALRDVPNQEGFPKNIIWPTSPQ